MHQLLGLGLGGLLGAHFDDVVQGLQFAQCFPLAGRMGGCPGWTEEQALSPCGAHGVLQRWVGATLPGSGAQAGSWSAGGVAKKKRL